MSEDPSVMVNDQRSAVGRSEDHSTPSKRFHWCNKIRVSSRDINGWLGRTLSILLRTTVIASILISIAFILRHLTDSNYSMEGISVPKAFEDAGYTGQVVANRIFNQIHSIITNERLADVSTEYKNANSDIDLNVEVVGIGVPIKSVTTILGETLGIDRNKTIRGNLSIDGDTLVFELNVNGDVEKFYAPYAGSVETAMTIIVARASEAILKHSNPYVLARHYLLRDAEGCFMLGRFILNKFPDDADVEPIGYFAMAGGYFTTGQIDLAEQMARAGVEKYPEDLNLQAALGTMLHRNHKYEEAIRQCKKIIKMLNRHTPINRVSRSYLNLGYLMDEINKPDSAMYYTNIVLERDRQFVEARAFMGKMYFIKRDTAAALQHWAIAFDNGLSISDFRRMMSNAPYVLNDWHVLELMKKIGQKKPEP